MGKAGPFPGEFQPGDLIGGTYAVLGYVGRGAMGHVYHVRHNILNGEYALKTLVGEDITDLDWKRFQNEQHAMANMNHPNLVNVYNSGLHDRVLPFYVMDLLHGHDLQYKIRKDGPLDLAQAIDYFLEVCAGTGYAHKKGIIHRDIKPGNVFILSKPDPSGAIIKVVDFGVAKRTITKDQEAQGLTGVGDAVGTPYYMSPEQTMGARVDARSDIYAIGCTLFEALTGAVPFRGRNPTEIMISHQVDEPPTLSKAMGGKQFPAELERIVAVCLAKPPAERYQSTEHLAADLAAMRPPVKSAVAVSQVGLPSLAAEEERAAPQAAPRPAGPIGIIPGARIESESETQSVNPLSLISKQLWLSIVVPSVAGVLALGGLAFWTFSQSTKKSQEQLKNFSTKVEEKSSQGLTADKTEYERQTALLEQAKNTDELDAKTPFAVLKKENGEEFRCFDFPKDVVIGQIQDSWEGEWKKASGKLKYDRWNDLTYKPDELVSTVPDCLKRFKPGDISCVQLPANADLALLRAMLNIPQLGGLDFSETTDLLEKSIGTLGDFHDLKKLVTSKTETDCKVLAKAKCWDKIEEVYFPITTNISAMLDVLSKSKSLKKLGIGPSHLTYADYETISKMSKLDYLDLNRNPVSNNEFAKLEGLSELVDLNLTNTDVDVNVVSSLQKLKNLKNLYISSPKLDKDDIKSIKNALPKVHVKSKA